MQASTRAETLGVIAISIGGIVASARKDCTWVVSWLVWEGKIGGRSWLGARIDWLLVKPPGFAPDVGVQP